MELLALPKSNAVTIRYSTDGSAPTSAAAATYDGVFRVPDGCRVVCAVAVASSLGLSSAVTTVQIPQRGQEQRTIDALRPATWLLPTRRDDSAAVWDLITHLECATQAVYRDILISAESANGEQNLEYTGALSSGYSAAEIKALTLQLQQIVGVGRLRCTVGSVDFSTGQALLDWLKAINQPFLVDKVQQPA